MPRRRSSPARRSAAEWGVRGLLAAVTVTLGTASVARALGYTLRAGDVERAHALAPGDGRVTALLARKLGNINATAADRATADRMARQALQQDPTAVVAASTLGLNAQVRGDTVGARHLFAYAERLSRRELQTQIWAVEDAVGRGDVAGALRHHDIALRTTRNATEVLFPVLASAITEPSVRVALVGTLAARPAWSPAFVRYVASDGPDPRATANLFLRLKRVGVTVSGESDAALVNALVSRDLIDAAWTYYAAVHPGADRRMSRDPAFTADSASPSRFDWMPINDAGVSASIQRGDRGGIVDFAAPASVGGPLLQQMQVLPPGDYRIEGHSAGIDQPEGAAPYWALSCRDGRELGRVDLPNSARGTGVFAGRFSVPVECPSQVLTLTARPSDTVTGVSGQIDRVRLAPGR